MVGTLTEAMARELPLLNVISERLNVRDQFGQEILGRAQLAGLLLVPTYDVDVRHRLTGQSYLLGCVAYSPHQTDDYNR